MAKLEDHQEPLMKDRVFREEYARAHEQNALVEVMVSPRTAAWTKQAELVARIGSTQPAIARLEGDRLWPLVRTLCRHAEATGMQLTLFGFERTDG